MDWTKSPGTLAGEIVDLIPLDEAHFSELAMLGSEKTIWEFIPIDMSTEDKRLAAFSTALAERDQGRQFPFAIFHRGEGKLIGSTRLMEIYPAHKRMEIGWTWLHPDYWATAVNPECKLLLLACCFDMYGAIRVQLKTDENNIRSRKAIAKIGGRPEGILRNDWIRDNGTFRSSAYFSILREEWPTVKLRLTAQYQESKMKCAQ